VSKQVARLGETLVALIADVGSLFGMYSHVYLEGVASGKLSVTLLTFEWFDIFMLSIIVVFKMTLCSELFTTNRAAKFLFLCMRHFVVLE
jgi:hypothetical protein